MKITPNTASRIWAFLHCMQQRETMDDDLRREAAFLFSRVDAARARTARRKALPAHPATLDADKRKAEKKQQRREQTAAIRAEVVRRADGKCETCGAADDPRSPLEMHHLIMGSGRRRQEQAASNCIMVCGMCHAFGHGRILYVGDFLIAWARRHGYAEAEKEVRRRMDKALLADPMWPRDEDETRRLGPDAIPREARAAHPESKETT